MAFKKPTPGINPFMKQDKMDDAATVDNIKKVAGSKAASKFIKEDAKADKQLMNKSVKQGKSDKEISKMDDVKDKKIMAKVMKGAKK